MKNISLSFWSDLDLFLSEAFRNLWGFGLVFPCFYQLGLFFLCPAIEERIWDGTNNFWKFLRSQIESTVFEGFLLQFGKKNLWLMIVMLCGYHQAITEPHSIWNLASQNNSSKDFEISENQANFKMLLHRKHQDQAKKLHRIFKWHAVPHYLNICKSNTRS